MDKNKLKGKYVTYIDKNSSYRTHKVVKITGKTLTVEDTLGTKHRIHPDKLKILGRQKKKELEDIEWK